MIHSESRAPSTGSHAVGFAAVHEPTTRNDERSEPRRLALRYLGGFDPSLRPTIASFRGALLTLLSTEVADVLRMLGLPHVRQQLFQVVLAFREPFQHVAKVSPHIQIMAMCAGHDRQDDRGPLSAFLAARRTTSFVVQQPRAADRAPPRCCQSATARR